MENINLSPFLLKKRISLYQYLQIEQYLVQNNLFQIEIKCLNCSQTCIKQTPIITKETKSNHCCIKADEKSDEAAKINSLRICPISCNDESRVGGGSTCISRRESQGEQECGSHQHSTHNFSKAIVLLAIYFSL